MILKNETDQITIRENLFLETLLLLKLKNELSFLMIKKSNYSNFFEHLSYALLWIAKESFISNQFLSIIVVINYKNPKLNLKELIKFSKFNFFTNLTGFINLTRVISSSSSKQNRNIFKLSVMVTASQSIQKTDPRI